MPIILNHRSNTVPNIRYDSVLQYGSNMLVAKTKGESTPVITFISYEPGELVHASEIDAANSDLIFSSFEYAEDISISRDKRFGAIVGDSGYIQKFAFSANQISGVSDAKYISDRIKTVAIAPDNKTIVAGFHNEGEFAKAYRFDTDNIFERLEPLVNPSGLPDNTERIAFLPGDRDVLLVGDPTTGDDYQLWSYNQGFIEQRDFGQSIVGSEGHGISVGHRQSDNCWPVFIGYEEGFVAYKWNGSKFVDTYGSVSHPTKRVYNVCQDLNGNIYAALSNGSSGSFIKSYAFDVENGVGSLIDTSAILSGETNSCTDIAFNAELNEIFFTLSGSSTDRVGKIKVKADGQIVESSNGLFTLEIDGLPRRLVIV